MKTIKKIQEMELKGKRVFVRVDFNVPLKHAGQTYEVADDTRIRGALPTIQYVMEQGGKCILASHLGRPDGKPMAKFSLEPVGRRLSELLKRDVVLTDDCIGDGARGLSHQMRNGDLMLLENLRFHSGEEENAIEFTNKLMELCDVYVSDAFGALHRAHASVAMLPKLMAEKGIGYLVQTELENLEPLRSGPARPFALVMGGAKVSDKVGVLEQFMPKVDRVLIGGAMAYAFLRARGKDIGKSFCDDRQVALATKILRGAEARNIRIALPIDHVVASSLKDTRGAVTTPNENIPADLMGVDIGPKTVAQFRDALAGVETIFWNGPMGVFEEPAFANGTFEVAKIISQSAARKIAGGGDVSAAIAASGCEGEFDFISTGGGATLEYLEGKELPGLKSLEVSVRSS
jgi:phosphoglycerate kinase